MGFHRKQAAISGHSTADFTGGSLVVPEFIGQIGYSTDGDTFISNGATAADWEALSPKDENVEVTSSNISGTYANLKALLDAMFPSSEKIDSSFLPSEIVSGLKFKGTFTLETELPDISSAEQGDIYIYTGASALTLSATYGTLELSPRDFVVFADQDPVDGTVETYKIDNSDVNLIYSGSSNNYTTPASTIDEAIDALDTALKTTDDEYDAHVAGTADNHAGGDVTYDNATSGLTATDVQAAIDEVDGIVDTLSSDMSGYQEISEDYQMKIYSEATEPTLGTDASVAIWEDTANSQTFLVYRDSTGTQKGVELG